MSVKSICLSTLVAALLGVGAVRGQAPLTPGQFGPGSGGEQMTPPSGGAGLPAYGATGPSADTPWPTPPSAPTSIGNTGYGVPLPPKDPQPAAGLSSWITYEGGDCCGPIGGNGP